MHEPESPSAVATATATAPGGGVDPGGARLWLRLGVGDGLYALPIDRVREILQVGRLTELPRVPPEVRGVMNLRGAVVPVIDLGARLTGQPVQVGRRSCIIVVDLPSSGSHPSLVAGVMVDAVFEVVDVEPAQTSAPPTLGTRIAVEYLSGVLHLQGRLLHLLDIERVLSQLELTEKVAAHVQ